MWWDMAPRPCPDTLLTSPTTPGKNKNEPAFPSLVASATPRSQNGTGRWRPQQQAPVCSILPSIEGAWRQSEPGRAPQTSLPPRARLLLRFPSTKRHRHGDLIVVKVLLRLSSFSKKIKRQERGRGEASPCIFPSGLK